MNISKNRAFFKRTLLAAALSSLCINALACNHTITATSDLSNVIGTYDCINVSGTAVNISDSNALITTNTLSIKASSTGVSASAGNITFNDANITAGDKVSSNVYGVENNGATLIFNGGSIEANSLANSNAIKNNSGSITLNGLKITTSIENSSTENAIYNAGEMTINQPVTINSGNVEFTNTSILNLAFNKNNASIKASNSQITVDGTIAFNGFADGSSVVKSSELSSGISATLIDAGSGSLNFYGSPTLGDNTDYILVDSTSSSISVDPTSKKLNSKVVSSLSWNSDTHYKGNFTIAAGTALEVNSNLGNISSTTNLNWDGKSLNKLGDGRLVLSSKNTYTGSTTLKAGTLQFGFIDSIATSSSVEVDGGVLDLNNNNQLFQSFSGGRAGTVKLGSATLTAYNALGNDTNFAGEINGGGALSKTGAGDLSLSGNTLWTGNTNINQGSLTLDGANAGAKLSSNVVGNASDSTLNLKNAASLTGGINTLKNLNLQDAKSTWNVTQNSKLSTLNNSGLINLNSNTLNLDTLTLNSSSNIEFDPLSITTVNTNVITANDVTLNGYFSMYGFDGLALPSKASEVVGSDSYVLIHANNSMTGTMRLAPSANIPDYIIAAQGSQVGNDYVVKYFQLAWTNGGTADGSGTFTTPADTSFDVDIDLTDQSGNFASRWNGKSLTKDGSGTLILSGKMSYSGNTYLDAGTLVLDGINGGGNLNSDIIGKAGSQLILQNGAVLTGKIDPTDVSVGANSSWKITDSSDTTNLINSGNITFVNDGKANKNLRVEGDYVGNNGLLTLNTVLDGDNSASDKLIVQGATSGITRVAVNKIGGNGQQTVNGIELVDVSGASNGIFKLEGRAVAGAYEYSLYQGLPTANDGNWYLRSTSNFRPEIGSYLANQNAIGSMFMQSLHQRQGENRYADAVRGEASYVSGSAWVRASDSSQNSNAGDDIIKTKSNTSVLQVGADIINWQQNSSSIQVGMMFGAGKSSSDSKSDSLDVKANGSTDGYAFGVYGTWYGKRDDSNSGMYLDSYLQFGHYKSSVKGDQLDEQVYHSNDMNFSLEAGYAISIAESDSGDSTWLIEPQAQFVYNHYNQDKIVENNGTEIFAKDTDSINTRFGASMYTIQELGNGMKIKPFVSLNWLHSSNTGAVLLEYGKSELLVKNNMPKNRYQIKLGVESMLSKNWNVWGHLSYQSGSNGYNQTEGQVGVKYLW